MIYETFLPNYYGTLIAAQQQALYLDNLYFYVADGVTKDAIANTNPKTIADEQEILNKVMYGGKLYPHNMIGMVKRIDWVSGTTYAKFNSRDPELDTKNFYVINSQRVVYKCIDNNGGIASVNEPVSVDQGSFRLADGYVWQYMYKLTDNELLNYIIGNYIPIVPDPLTVSSAKRGTISSIDVIDGGVYDATNDGKILQVASNTLFRVSDTASPSNDIYDGMGLYIGSGPAAGKVAQIQTYTANNSGRWVSTATPLTAVTLDADYSIAPFVKLTGNGFGGSARAVMAGKQVKSIEVLNRGEEFTLATATLQANASYSVDGSLQVNLSPPRGHGADVLSELYADAILVNVELDNYTISNGFPVNDTTFCRIGLMRRLLNADASGVYNENSFNNTFLARVSPSFGNYEVGDNVSLSTPSPGAQLNAKIVHANTTHITGVYESATMTFTQGNVISNQDGITGSILDIDQPQIRLMMADVVSITNTETIKRDENSRETLQLVIRIK